MLSINSKFRSGLSIVALVVSTGWLVGCVLSRNVCDTTPDGSVWLTVVRLVWAEENFHKAHGYFVTLAEMTNLEPGLPPEVTAGQMGSYTIRIELGKTGYILRANPDLARSRRRLPSFYADQTGLITLDVSGKPATSTARGWARLVSVTCSDDSGTSAVERLADPLPTSTALAEASARGGLTVFPYRHPRENSAMAAAVGNADDAPHVTATDVTPSEE